MKDTAKTFAAIAAIIAGIIVLASLPYNGYFDENLPKAAIGVALLAAGITFFMRRGRVKS